MHVKQLKLQLHSVFMGKLPSHLKLFIYVFKDRSLYVALAVLQFTLQTELGWLSSKIGKWKKQQNYYTELFHTKGK